MNNFGPSNRAAKGHMPSMVPGVHSDVIIAVPELCAGGPVWVVVIVGVALWEPQAAPGEGQNLQARRLGCLAPVFAHGCPPTRVTPLTPLQQDHIIPSFSRYLLHSNCVPMLG